MSLYCHLPVSHHSFGSTQNDGTTTTPGPNPDTDNPRDKDGDSGDRAEDG
jgi:hypothetical protein